MFSEIISNASLGPVSSLAFSALPLAQIPSSLKTSFQYGLGVMFMAGFLWGVVKIWNGADKMSKGDADGKMGIVSGIIIAGGRCDHGRDVFHLRSRGRRPDSTVLISGHERIAHYGYEQRQ